MPGDAANTPPPGGAPDDASSTEATRDEVEGEPGLDVTTTQVDDVHAASVVRFDTARITGLAPEPAARAQQALDAIAGFNIDEWRSIDPAVCEFGGPPCGDWVQIVTEIPCTQAYLCILVEGSGIFPGTASSSTITQTLAIDVQTGEPGVLEDAVSPATVSDVIGFVTEKVARKQNGPWGMDCYDPTHVFSQPLTADDLNEWLPTSDGVRVWLPSYRVAAGSEGSVPVTVTWRELDDAQEYVDLGLTGCDVIGIDDAGLPITMVDGNRTASGYLCDSDIADLPDIVPGSNNILYTRVLQIILQGFGFYSGAPDGIYDAATQKAVRRYQDFNNLASDGQVGPRTWGHLQGAHCRNWG